MTPREHLIVAERARRGDGSLWKDVIGLGRVKSSEMERVDATLALLETAADRRETINRQIYTVNKETIERGAKGNPSAILVRTSTQHDPREAAHLVDRLNMAGVDIYRADAPFEADGEQYAAGTFVIPMTQVFARYAKDML